MRRFVIQMQEMPNVRVRLTGEEKKELLKYGGISKGVREGSGSTSRLISHERLSTSSKSCKRRTPSRPLSEREVKLIRVDRTRR